MVFKVDGGRIATKGPVDVVLSGFASTEKNSTIMINLCNLPLSLSNLVVTCRRVISGVCNRVQYRAWIELPPSFREENVSGEAGDVSEYCCPDLDGSYSNKHPQLTHSDE